MRAPSPSSTSLRSDSYMRPKTNGPRAAVLPIGLLLLVSGCATHGPLPLALGHPAHLDAGAAPSRAKSLTLAYTSADMPSARSAAVSTTHPRGSESAGGAHQFVVGEGEVIATMPNAGQIVLDHKEIHGFMEAMTMGYRIEPPSLLGRVKPGDAVRFTIDVQQRAIVAIERLR